MQYNHLSGPASDAQLPSNWREDPAKGRVALGHKSPLSWYCRRCGSDRSNRSSSQRLESWTSWEIHIPICPQRREVGCISVDGSEFAVVWHYCLLNSLVYKLIEILDADKFLGLPLSMVMLIPRTGIRRTRLAIESFRRSRGVWTTSPPLWVHSLTWAFVAVTPRSQNTYLVAYSYFLIVFFDLLPVFVLYYELFI